MSGFVFKEKGKCVPGVFDWFGELWGLSGCCEGKCHKAYPCVFQADSVHLLFQHPELRPAKLKL